MTKGYESVEDAAAKLHRVADQMISEAKGRKVKWSLKITFEHVRGTPGIYGFTLVNRQ
jgi:hypothetical protein